MILPKILHYVWLGNKPLHPLMQDWQDKWAVLHPGWEIKVWHEVPGLPKLLAAGDELVECRNPGYLALCPTYAKRSDVWRYEILEQLGGVYLDTDFEPVKNLEPLLDDVEAFAGLCLTRYGWTTLSTETKVIKEVGCSIMGATPHHPWLRDLVVQTVHQDPKAQLALAFPFLTRVTAKHPDVRLFEPDIFYSVPWNRYNSGRQSLRKEKPPESAYAVHQWSSNWFAEGLRQRS